jgi:hypothetical protein
MRFCVSGVSRIACAVLLVSFGMSVHASKERKLLVMPPQEHRRIPSSFLTEPGTRVLADYEAMQAIAVPDAAGDRVARQLVKAGFEVVDLEDVIRTPRMMVRTDEGNPLAAPFETGLFLVQYSAPPMPAWQAHLRQVGVDVVESLQERAIIISSSAAAAAGLATIPWIQYVAPYLPEYKFQPQGGDQVEFTVHMADTPLSALAVRRVSDRVGGFVAVSSYGLQLSARVSTSMSVARDLINEPFVLGVESVVPSTPSDERQALGLTGKTTATAAGRYLDFLAARGITPDLLTASGIVIDIADTGVDHGCNYPVASPDLKGRFVFHQGTVVAANGTFADDHGHGTVVAGIAGGNPLLSAKNLQGGSDPGTAYQYSDAYGVFYPGLGVAPGVQLSSTKIIKSTGSAQGTVAEWTRRAVSRPCSTAVTTPCPTSGPSACAATVQNHSHNEYDSTGSNAGVYTTNAREFDISVRNAERTGITGSQLAVTMAVGNYGQRSSDSTTMVLAAATAKNVISLGAVESSRPGIPVRCSTELGSGDNPMLRHSAQGYNVLAYASRRGTRDRRFKPDLLAPATLSVGPHAYGMQNYFCDQIGPDGGGQFMYHGASGTSFAAPAAAGAVALLRYHYSTKYGSTPSPAMYKAMLVAGAKSITGATDRLGAALNTTPTVKAWPNEQQGFGVINLSDLLDTAVVKSWHDQQTILTQGQKYEKSIVVADPSKPVRVVLAYTDAPGAIQDPANPAYYAAAVNGLTLTGYPSGLRYYGNFTDTNGYSAADTAGCGRPTCPSFSDSVNNVEVLNFNPTIFADPTKRTFVIRVMASPINGVGVPGASGGANNQDFALFVLNGRIQ